MNNQELADEEPCEECLENPSTGHLTWCPWHPKNRPSTEDKNSC